MQCRYGFVVYGDGQVTDVACKGLNGMRMGDRTLTVRRATDVSCTTVDPVVARLCCIPVLAQDGHAWETQRLLSGERLM